MPRVDIAILTVIPEEYDAVISSLAAYGCKTELDPGTATMPNLYGWVTGDLAGSNGQIYRVSVGMVVRPGPGRMASADRNWLETGIDLPGRSHLGKISIL